MCPTVDNDDILLYKCFFFRIEANTGSSGVSTSTILIIIAANAGVAFLCIVGYCASKNSRREYYRRGSGVSRESDYDY